MVAARSTELTSRLKQLAGSLAYARSAEASPYAALVHVPSLRAALSTRFSRESLALQQLPLRSPLSTCVEAGLVALPKLAKLSTVMKAKYADHWRRGATLPLDLELGDAYTYHSTFTCPISKEVATPGNPPMLLLCGHVLSLGAVSKLARGARSTRFKCPYCPADSTSASAQALTI